MFNVVLQRTIVQETHVGGQASEGRAEGGKERRTGRFDQEMLLECVRLCQEGNTSECGLGLECNVNNNPSDSST